MMLVFITSLEWGCWETATRYWHPPLPGAHQFSFCIPYTSQGEGFSLPGSPLLSTLPGYLKHLSRSHLVLITNWKGSPESPVFIPGVSEPQPQSSALRESV